MKLLFLLLLVTSVTTSWTQRYWSGSAGDGQWSSAANWVGNAVPLPADEVVLDNSYITGNYSVVLPAGMVTTTINTLNIAPASGQNIRLTLPATNTAPTGLAVTATGDAFVLHTGSLFRNNSGAASGTHTVQVTGNLRINNGGHYIHGTVRSHTGILDRLSAAAGTEQGIFEFDFAGGGTLSLSNRTFGTLVFSGTAVLPGARVYSASGANPVNVRGALTVNTNTTLNISFATAGVLTVGSNLQVFSGATFNMQTAANNNLVQVNGGVDVSGTITQSGSGTPTLVFTGNQLQTFSVTGTISNRVIISIHKTAGQVTLQSAVTIPYRLLLNSGNLVSTAVNLLIIGNDAAILHHSATSFIDGPVQKTGNSSFTFPIGRGAVYAPLQLPAGGLETDVFTAAYYRSNPGNVISNTYQLPVNHISQVEYWTLDLGETTAPRAGIALMVSEYSFARDGSLLLVTQNDAAGNPWQNLGAGETGFTPPAPYITGMLVSSEPLSTGRYFTLATTGDFGMNPLPLFFRDFWGSRNNNYVQLEWELLQEMPTGMQLHIQKAKDKNGSFTTIWQSGNVGAGRQQYIDKQTDVTVSYYRLLFIREDSAVGYSNTVMIKSRGAVLSLVQVYPTLQPRTVIKMVLEVAVAENIDWTVWDNRDRVVLRQKELLKKGIYNTQLHVAALPAGAYLVTGLTATGKRLAYRFVK